MNDRFKTDDPNEPYADYIEQASGALSVGDLPRAVDLVLKELRRSLPKKPVFLVQQEELLELVLYCPRCKEQHIDEGTFATKPHKDHACQSCGLVWRPCKLPSVGVQFFSGPKTEAVGVDKDHEQPSLKARSRRPWSKLPGSALG